MPNSVEMQSKDWMPDWLPDSVHAWIRELGWQESDITSLEMKNHLEQDGVDIDKSGRRWQRWKSKGRTYILWRGEERQEKYFPRVSQQREQGGE